MELKYIHAKPDLLPCQPTQAKTAVKSILNSFVCCYFYCIMHAQYFALLYLSLKLQVCGEASLEFLFNFLS